MFWPFHNASPPLNLTTDTFPQYAPFSASLSARRAKTIYNSAHQYYSVVLATILKLPAQCDFASSVLEYSAQRCVLITGNTTPPWHALFLFSSSMLSVYSSTSCSRLTPLSFLEWNQTSQLNQGLHLLKMLIIRRIMRRVAVRRWDVKRM